MKKYEAYKDSYVESIGLIPEIWISGKLKYVLNIQSGKGISVEDMSPEGKYPVYGGNGILGYTNSYTSDGEDLIIGRVGALCGNVHHVKGKKWISDNALWATTNFNAGFLKYYLQSIDLNRLANKNAQPLITGTMVKDQFIGIPELSEQTTIANYLDHKTAQLDTLISKKEKLIELLQEERTAIINHAVTKGLNPNVPMKDSGIEWLGEIPEHWEVKKLKYLIRSMKGGGTPSTDNPIYWNGNIPWVSPKDMKVPFIKTTEDYVTEVAIKESSTQLIEENHLLLVVRSGILKHTLPMAINVVPVTLNQDMKAIVPNELITVSYLFQMLMGFENSLLTLTKKIGATVDSVDMEAFVNFKFPIPSIFEQDDIVKFISTTQNRIDAIITKAEQEIELLKEYKTALISEVVTGKVDVRNEILN